MKIKSLKKDKHKSVRINKDILKKIEELGMTLQDYLDQKLDNDFGIKIEDLKLVSND